MSEDYETRLKRLRMRSWRRGMKEMDIILGGYSDARLADLSPEDLDAYESMLSENDQVLYAWITGAEPTPEDQVTQIGKIVGFLKDKGMASLN